MSFKCPFCSRTFSQRTPYSQHVQVCIKKAEIKEAIDDNISVLEDEPFQEAEQDTSFSNMESTHSNILSEISVMSYEEGINLAEEFEEPEEPEELKEPEEPEILEEFNVSESDEFSNDAYKDLMVLVTKYKISNKAGNAIIKFFNKHSALSKSPLPKTIEKGRTFMNHMKFPNLSFNKICMVRHYSKEYFLHYQDLIQCVKNLLSIPDIAQHFVLSFENYEQGGKLYIKNNIMGCGGRKPKLLCQWALNYYQLFYIRMQQPQIH